METFIRKQLGMKSHYVAEDRFSLRDFFALCEEVTE
jgi:hypothetical protein